MLVEKKFRWESRKVVDSGLQVYKFAKAENFVGGAKLEEMQMFFQRVS